MSDERKPFVINGRDELNEWAGKDLGTSEWVTVNQEDINTFAELTGDDQWIHVDLEKAKAGPYGTTIQYGFLTLSKSTGFLWEICVVEGFSVILNYGLNKVRFPSPLKTGQRYRMHANLAEVNELKGGVETVYKLTYEVEGEAKPCCVADLVFRYYD
ncbi:MaoC family dehydratase [Ammonicoccus fulvus]|uniref:MaoC family dehydratase n=1 Tax=Ammonicoccus fulvus TaxID=3138240 RepID=A0ABZ3FVA6_9ACTN